MGLFTPENPVRRWLLRAPLLMILTGFAALVMLTAWRGVLAAADSSDFPADLAVKVELLPWLFPIHMVSGAAGLILGPAALALGQFEKSHRWHHWLGRIAALDVLVAGLTAFPVALVQPVTRVSAWGFVAQGSVWLALLARGLWHIRAGRIERHRRCMILMMLVMSGAIFFRIYLAFWAIMAHGSHFAAFYACDAWIAWGVPLAIGIAVFMRGEVGRPRRHNGAGPMP